MPFLCLAKVKYWFAAHFIIVFDRNNIGYEPAGLTVHPPPKK